MASCPGDHILPQPILGCSHSNLFNDDGPSHFSLCTSLNFISTGPQSLHALCDDHTRPSQNLVLSSPLDDEESPRIHPYSDIPIMEVNTSLLGPAFEQGLRRSISKEQCVFRHLSGKGVEKEHSTSVFVGSRWMNLDCYLGKVNAGKIL